MISRRRRFLALGQCAVGMLATFLAANASADSVTCSLGTTGDFKFLLFSFFQETYSIECGDGDVYAWAEARIVNASNSSGPPPELQVRLRQGDYGYAVGFDANGSLLINCTITDNTPGSWAADVNGCGQHLKYLTFYAGHEI
jgi:hypothetical protein